MTTDDQIRDEKLQYNINRKAAEISALSSGKINKYEYLTGEDILQSEQQQIIEQAKFSYSPLRKAFQKQIKTIEDQGQKQVEALKDLKPKEQTKPIKGKSNNQSRTTNIFNDLINKRKETMNKLYEGVDYNNLKFDYVGPTKDVSFYEYIDSKEFFNSIKNNEISFSDLLKRQNEFLNKLSNIKIGKKTNEQREVIYNLNKFYLSREEVINFFKDYSEIVLDAKQNKAAGTGLINTQTNASRITNSSCTCKSRQ